MTCPLPEVLNPDPVWQLSLPLLLAAGDPPRPAPPPRPLLVAYGDSFTAWPSGAGRYGWLQLVAEHCGMTPVNMAVSGAGYVRVAGSTFPFAATVHPVPDAAVVVVMGSQNDRHEDPAAVRLAAIVTLEAIARAAPAARVLVVGGHPFPAPPSANALAVQDALRDVCRARGLPFLDPIGERWLTAVPGLVGPDGEHPNADGQAVIAARVAPAVAALLAELAEATTT